VNRIGKTTVLVLSLLVFSYVTLGYVLGKTSEETAYRPLGVFSEVLQHIRQDYVEEPNPEMVMNGALRGLLEQLDPRSSYLSPREYTEYKKQSDNPSRGETGAVLSKRFGYVAVVAVLPGSPAEKAGLRQGDVLEAINGFTTREMSIGQAQVLLGGEPGTGVKLQVIRPGRSEAQDVEVVRAALSAPKILAERIEGEVAYLRVPTLAAGKANEVREKLQQFDRQGARKLILDLRDTAVGEAQEGIALARLFLSSGKIATLRGQTVSAQDFSADPSKVVWKHPVSVLISFGTSGAAEIAAAALAENKRAETFGERTFGSASEQKTIPLDDGAALILTVANYHTPAGRSIPAEGVTPSVEVRAAREDTDFTDPGPATAHPSLDDPVLKRALEHLRGAALPPQGARKTEASGRRAA
jgi:carboxyl-terminal processing protease